MPLGLSYLLVDSPKKSNCFGIAKALLVMKCHMGLGQGPSHDEESHLGLVKFMNCCYDGKLISVVFRRLSIKAMIVFATLKYLWSGIEHANDFGIQVEICDV